MKIYLVGGAVRDKFLGLQPKDLDYVVVGSSPEQMENLGYKQVGKDFPVFLHPHTGEEYALARTERKSGCGYKGFICNWEGVSLEDDLARRDLTINAIAIGTTTGDVIDPYNGVEDISKKVLRHTTEHFREDPLRVLRVARLKARFGPEWYIDKETLSLIQTIVASGELEHLTPERVWRETEKALSTQKPSIYFDVLLEHTNLFPSIKDLSRTDQRRDHHPEGDVWTHTKLVVDYSSTVFKDSEITFACLCHDLGKPECWEKYGNAHGHEDVGIKYIEAFCDKWKVPNKYRELATLSCRYHTKVHGCMGRGTNKGMKPKSIMKMFEETQALTKPARFKKMLKVCEADAKGRGKTDDQIQRYISKSYQQRQYLQECLESVVSLDTKTISVKLLGEGKAGTKIGTAIRVARINKIREVYKRWM